MKEIKGNTLTDGARALAKHVHRSSNGWWGNFAGSDSDKNRLALNVINHLISHCCWMNIYQVQPHNCVFEIRVDEGYGARWSRDGLKLKNNHRIAQCDLEMVQSTKGESKGLLAKEELQQLKSIIHDAPKLRHMWHIMQITQCWNKVSLRMWGEHLVEINEWQKLSPTLRLIGLKLMPDNFAMLLFSEALLAENVAWFDLLCCGCMPERFIGFLEPYMEDGHLKGWRH
ncbi:hypothetical protein ACLOJK_011751 [Asimina triloba]